MSDLKHLENMLKQYIEGNKDAASDYLSMYLTSKMNKIVNEKVETDKTNLKNDTTPKIDKWEIKDVDGNWHIVNLNKKIKIGPVNAKDKDYKKLAQEEADKRNKK